MKILEDALLISILKEFLNFCLFFNCLIFAIFSAGKEEMLGVKWRFERFFPSFSQKSHFFLKIETKEEEEGE
jgi:hypothetical protein